MDTSTRLLKIILKKKIKAQIDVVDTGIETLTGTRLLRLANKLKETFMLTYGDGLSNIDLNKLLNFHNRNKKKLL